MGIKIWAVIATIFGFVLIVGTKNDITVIIGLLLSILGIFSIPLVEYFTDLFKDILKKEEGQSDQNIEKSNELVVPELGISNPVDLPEQRIEYQNAKSDPVPNIELWRMEPLIFSIGFIAFSLFLIFILLRAIFIDRLSPGITIIAKYSPILLTLSIFGFVVLLCCYPVGLLLYQLNKHRKILYMFLPFSASMLDDYKSYLDWVDDKYPMVLQFANIFKSKIKDEYIQTQFPFRLLGEDIVFAPSKYRDILGTIDNNMKLFKWIWLFALDKDKDSGSKEEVIQAKERDHNYNLAGSAQFAVLSSWVMYVLYETGRYINTPLSSLNHYLWSLGISTIISIAVILLISTIRKAYLTTTHNLKIGVLDYCLKTWQLGFNKGVEENQNPSTPNQTTSHVKIKE